MSAPTARAPGTVASKSVDLIGALEDMIERAGKDLTVRFGSPEIDDAHRLLAALHRLEATGDQDIVDVLEQLADSLPAAGMDTRDNLTHDQEAVLHRTGSLVQTVPPLAERASTRTAMDRLHLLADSLTSAEVAASLSVGQSRVRQRVAQRTLLAIRTAAGLRFPRFQFLGERELPGWDKVAPRFPKDAHPVGIYRFLRTPHADLDLGDGPVSPHDWLADGGGPEAVADLVDDAYRLP